MRGRGQGVEKRRREPGVASEARSRGGACACCGARAGRGGRQGQGERGCEGEDDRWGGIGENVRVERRCEGLGEGEEEGGASSAWPDRGSS